ncbi:MAG: UDP-3-O-(3-hydroxymyristoyl)glucosamine N-acyltransferase [Gemmatimonadota bacterium]
MTAGEIRTLAKGTLRGDEARVVQEVAPLESAGPSALSFIASARYRAYLHATRAGVVLVGPQWAAEVPEASTAVIVDDPHQALQVVLGRMFPSQRPPPGVHPTAEVAGSADVSPEASVGPYAVVGPGARIGASIIAAHVVVGADCEIGDGVTIYPHVTLYGGVIVGDRVVIHSGARIGKDGFGYVWKDGAHRKIPQVGGCVIEEDVEIGTNVTIDRGSIGDTRIGAGTKIDNLVHVGHNVQIGEHALLISQVGISGSTTIGEGAVLAGQSGIGGHLKIGAGARIGAQAGVIGDVPPGETYSGYPARPHRAALRSQASVFKLPQMMERLKRLERAVFGEADRKEPRND